MTALYKLSLDPYGVHQKVINQIKSGNILDIGCASGYIAQQLVLKNCQITGIEIDPKSAQVAGSYCHKMIVCDIEQPTTFKQLGSKRFDYILLIDVLEHLKAPDQVLANLKKYLAPKGQIIISTPNIAFLTIRLRLLQGQFSYTDWGIMDRTHLKFFTRQTLTDLIIQSGYHIVKFDNIGNFTQLPFSLKILYPFIGKYNWWRKLEQKITSLWPEGLAIQFLVTLIK